MKKSKLLLFGIAFLVLSMISCHKGRNKLVNSWKVTAVEAKTPMPDSIKNEILEKGNLTFTKDGYVSGFLKREISQGTFVLTKGGKSLVINDETGTPYPCESTITNDQLILESDDMKLTLDKK
ncbi:hypothetical protein [Flavobacterium agrisoli]|uniref:Uncharacterized protein n=1 Tax=Flavobacterium agrisoli TaxID=2793066 RepID=A0A934PHW7_9FLAO|nr:hypothetical protein [Flavobacterium agrisoli]MBK0368352.1 hypothetical protein [Flavobacterium agrisoli]